MINLNTLRMSDRHKLLNLRLWFSAMAWAHLVFLALKLLTLDFTDHPNPILRMYQHARWQLITAWFNLLMMAYFPVSFYCDWREKKGEHHWPHVVTLNKIRHIVFTSILIPTTFWADTIFWRLWNKDREMIVPLVADEYLPMWSHHCMHTVSLVAVILDFVMVPRERPKTIKLNLAIMTVWVLAYCIIIALSWTQGIYVYPIFSKANALKLFLFALFMYVEHLFYFTMQWRLLDLMNGEKQHEKKHEEKHPTDTSISGHSRDNGTVGNKIRNIASVAN